MKATLTGKVKLIMVVTFLLIAVLAAGCTAPETPLALSTPVVTLPMETPDIFAATTPALTGPPLPTFTPIPSADATATATVPGSVSSGADATARATIPGGQSPSNPGDADVTSGATPPGSQDRDDDEDDDDEDDDEDEKDEDEDDD